MKKEDEQEINVPEIMMDLVNSRLFTYIEGRYKSVNEAAQKCGVPQTTMSNMFKNSRGPSVLVLLKLLYLDPEMDLVYILTGKHDFSFIGTTDIAEPIGVYSSKPGQKDLVSTIEKLTDAITGLTISNMKLVKN